MVYFVERATGLVSESKRNSALFSKNGIVLDFFLEEQGV